MDPTKPATAKVANPANHFVHAVRSLGNGSGLRGEDFFAFGTSNSEGVIQDQRGLHVSAGHEVEVQRESGFAYGIACSFEGMPGNEALWPFWEELWE